jgi:hypothetical protein
MQNRYAGDIGDFIKLGLLRHLACPASAGGAGLSVAFNWYLAPDEWHNRDGKHIAYLYPENRWHQSLRLCDPDLMERLARVVASDRSVDALEASGALPPEARVHREMLDPVRGIAGRRTWHRRALEALGDNDIVFADPDNGLRSTAAGAKLHKFALVRELADYAHRGQSLVVYHHADRSADSVTQARRRLAELAAGVGQSAVGAVIARRGSCRFFLVTASDAHRERFAVGLQEFARLWTPHAELIS